MSQLTVTNDGIAACANAQENGFKISITHFKVGTPPSGFPVSTSDTGTFVGTNDGMTKDVNGNPYTVFQGEVSLCQVLTDGSVQLTFRIPIGYPVPGETWSLTEIGLYLENGQLFAHGETAPAYPKQHEYGIEIRAIVVLTQLCDVINVTVGESVSLPSTVVRNLEAPEQSMHNAIVVLDQNNNLDSSTSPSLALQYGPGNEAWGYVGYSRIFNGPVSFSSTSAFILDPVLNGFWLLDGELCIAQIVNDPSIPSGSSPQASSRRVRYNVAGNEFTELDGKPFSVELKGNQPIVAIWRDPEWMLSRYGQTADIEVKSAEFQAKAGDYVFVLPSPVAGTAIVHINTVHQTDSYYIENGTKLVLKKPLPVACTVFAKWITVVDSFPPRAIKFKRVTTIPNGNVSYSLAGQVTPEVATQDAMPLVYASSVLQHNVDYDPVYRTLNFSTAVANTQASWLETVFFERHTAHGFPVLEKFAFAGGKQIYRSPLPIADTDHVLVFVGQVYQRLDSFELLDSSCVRLSERAPLDAQVTLVVSSVVGSLRNVPLMDEYTKLREYVFCKLGRPDDRLFDIAPVVRTGGQTATLQEEAEDGLADMLFVAARNVLQTTTVSINADRTQVSVPDPVGPQQLRVVQLLHREYDRDLFSIVRTSVTTVAGQREYPLTRACRDRANLIVLLGQVLQTHSFTLVKRGRAIKFDTEVPAGLRLSITHLANNSAVNGPFLFRDHLFRSTGTRVYRLPEELDYLDSLALFVGRVYQVNFSVDSDLRTITFDDDIPLGVDVLAKHLHHRCYESHVSF